MNIPVLLEQLLSETSPAWLAGQKDAPASFVPSTLLKGCVWKAPLA